MSTAENSQKKEPVTAKADGRLSLLNDDFQIIGLGASAGGLEALQGFFDNLPEGCLHAFVIVQHLSPDYKSLMDELLAKNTSLPIHHIEDGMRVESGNVYLIPPRKNLMLSGEILHLLERPENQVLHLPIDYFFRSLAKELEERAIGLVLSGTGSDGTRGLRTIKDVGGIVMVQSPESAKFNGMPNSAIATGLVDYVLPVTQMPTELLELIEHPRSLPDTPERMLEQNPDILNRILRQVTRTAGMDFEAYKRPTLVRRMGRRMMLRKLTQPEDYLELLQTDPDEAQVLCKEFLIGVTRFFRDTEAFEKLEKDVLPEMVQRLRESGKIKVWSLGCSTGEEAFSLAISIRECMDALDIDLEVKILATDLDADHITIAARGVFPESIAEDMPRERLERYFVHEGDSYRVKQHIRSMIIFSRHDALKDPPFTRADLVCCRNMMIYLQSTAQQQLLAVMHYALNLHGVLFLGPSESLGELRNWFTELDRRWKLYRNNEVTRAINFSGESSHGWSRAKKPVADIAQAQRSLKSESRLAELLNETMASELGLAAVFVDDQFNIQHGVGEFDKYLKLKSGRLSFNLMAMLPEALAGCVRTAVNKANSDTQKVLYKGVTVSTGKKTQQLDVLVVPYPVGPDARHNFLVAFLERRNIKHSERVIEAGKPGLVDDERFKLLEDELHSTRQNLQATVEEVETSNEELQATNEELLASNEELQSTNEELQSVNEELHTVNSEYQQKVEELALISAEMGNLLSSTEIGTIFLDEDMCIRKFNKAVHEHFKLLETDIGRPIEHFSSNFSVIDSRDLLEQTRSVLLTGVPIEREISTETGKWFLQRINPFRKESGSTEGVVITFVDIRKLKLAEYAIVSSEEKYRTLYDESPLLYLTIHLPSGRIEGCNNTFCKRLGFERNEVIGRNVFDFYAPGCLEAVRQAHQQLQDQKRVRNAELQFLSSSDEQIDVMLSAARMQSTEETKSTRVERFNAVFTDVTELKAARRLVDQHVEHLEHFAYVSTHDLRGPMVNLKQLMAIVEAEGWITPENERILGKVSSNVDSLHDALTDLIELVRNPKATDRTSIELIDMAKLTTEIIEGVEHLVHEHQAQIDLDFSAAPSVSYFPVHLKSLLHNLIGNAIKYQRPGRRPRVKVESDWSDGMFLLKVTDNGRGIHPEYQGRVFDLFYQTDRQSSGQGLGLYIVRSMVEKHGGRIELESQVGEGSCFRVWLVPQESSIWTEDTPEDD